MSEPIERNEVNAAQRENWNTRQGDHWATMQEALDARFEPLTARLMAAAAPDPADHALDIGCGTGDTALRLAAVTRRVTGIDISAPMLAVARRRAAAAGHTNLALLEADAQTHDLAADPLIGGDEPTLAFSRFGVMFFADPVAAFANIRKALAANARLCFLTWAPMVQNPWFHLPRTAAIRHLGEPDPVPPRTPGPFAFAEPDYVEEILQRAGFSSISIEPLELRFAGGTVAEEARFLIGMGPASILIRERGADEATVARIEADVAAALAPLAPGGRVDLPAVLWLVRARNP